MNKLSIEISCPDIVRAAEIIAEAILRGGGSVNKDGRKNKTVFSENDITAMNAMILGGKNVVEIANVFGCSKSAVYRRKELLLKEVRV